MKKSTLLASLSVFLLLGAGWQTQQTQKQVISLQSIGEERQIQTTLYRGFYFDIEYPENFIPRPTAPTTIHNDQTYIQTDEAYFTSPKGTVEFFVYSPIWSGDPETYLIIAPTEEIVSEKIEEIKGNERSGQLGDKIIRWVTIKAKDDSYYRSFISIKEHIGTGSDLHHVFGIKYKDNESYENYREAYTTFKETLQQYTD